jgi:hypothetical protein
MSEGLDIWTDQLAGVRRDAEREATLVADELEAALKLAGLPPLPGLTGIGTDIGPLVHLGGYNATAARMLAQWITEHARCRNRVLEGEAVATADVILSAPVNPAAISGPASLAR